MDSSNIGVIQPYFFEPDSDSKEEEEELHVQGRQQVEGILCP